MPTAEEVDERATQAVIDILKRELRLVPRPDFEESETWMVKPGNLEHCAKLIVQNLYS